MVEQGARLGDYQIVGVHPGGGYRAVHPARDHRALIEVCESEDWRAATMHVLRATSIIEAIAHPGMARIVGHGLYGGHRRWIACELADGLALSEIFERRRLSVAETIGLVRDAAEVLDLAHASGIVHGDLQAHRVVIACGARSFPLQLGGWHHACEPAHELADRDDVYALGALAFRAITGRYPGAYAPELVPGVPGMLSALIVHMLAADPERRPRADQVLAAARDLAGDRVRAKPIARIRWTPAHPIPAVEISEVIELVDRRARS